MLHFVRIRIGNPDWAQTPNLIDANNLSAQFEFRPLFDKRLVVSWMRAAKAEMGLEVNGDRATWRYGETRGKPSRIEVQGERISKPYVEITLNVMRRFGVDVKRTGWRYFDVPGVSFRSPGTIFVEGDASSASYFLAAGALGGGPVRVEGVGRNSIQGDVRFTEVLERMGAQVSLAEDAIEVTGPKARLKPIDMDMNHIPDAAMTAAVLALFADGRSTLRNIGSWRVKETDRLAAMATELRKLGADVEEGSDFLKISPKEVRPGIAVDTYDDHRMAMSFSLVSLAGVPVTIKDPDCVAKTFPEYFEVFRSITA
jgi:3-phosphoshikimate 1-carboxyvinyltransferase